MDAGLIIKISADKILELGTSKVHTTVHVECRNFLKFSLWNVDIRLKHFHQASQIVATKNEMLKCRE